MGKKGLSKLKGLSKKQIIVSIIVAIIVFAVIGLGITCAVNKESPIQLVQDIFTSNDEQIVGKWQNDDKPGISAYEFYDDGTYDSYVSSFSFSGNYTIDGNKIKLVNPKTAKEVVYKYSINGDSLKMTIVEEGGVETADKEKISYTKVEYLNMKSLSDILKDITTTQEDTSSEE